MKKLGILLSSMPFAASLNYRDISAEEAAETYEVAAIDWVAERVTLKLDDAGKVLTVPFAAVTLHLAGPICGPETFRAFAPRRQNASSHIIPTTGSDRRFERLAMAMHRSTTFGAEGCVIPSHLADPLVKAYYGKWDAEEWHATRQEKPMFISPGGQKVSRNAMLKAVSVPVVPEGYRPVPDAPGYFINRDGEVLAGTKKVLVHWKSGMPYLRLYTKKAGVYVNLASLVLRAFGDQPELVNAAHVRWRDSNRFNNNIDNLEYVKAS